MTQALDRTAFLSEPTRLRIAELCRYKALTHAQIAAQLKRSSGALSQRKTMLKHKALKEVRRKAASGRRGAPSFRLNASWEKHLEAAKLRQRPAALEANQDLLLISLQDEPAACAAISAGIEEIAWGARLSGGTIGLVVAPRADDDGVGTVRVISALGPGASGVWNLRVEEILSPAELREWAKRTQRLEGRPAELPP